MPLTSSDWFVPADGRLVNAATGAVYSRSRPEGGGHAIHLSPPGVYVWAGATVQAADAAWASLLAQARVVTLPA